MLSRKAFIFKYIRYMYWKKKYIYLMILLVVPGTLFLFSIPRDMFNDPLSTVVLSSDNELLGAKIATDGQWRFPEIDSIPEKFRTCIIAFEDRYFYKHPGFNPFSLIRAALSNIKAGKIVSGGSTLTMQTVRLSRKNKPRTVPEKLLEIYLSLCLETKYSKDKILKLYASHAPFGGNVVGLEAAAWRYYNCDPWTLSWAETAALAVLPNAPSLVHPGKNREVLMEKRNRLLYRLLLRGEMDSLTYSLSITESLPDKPVDLPQLAPHLLERISFVSPGSKVKTTLNAFYQQRLNDVINRHKERLYPNHIRNAACIIMETLSGEVLAYVGNIRNNEYPEYGGENDMVMANRSTGSILKPFLFAYMLDRGEILPGTLIPDIPTRYRDFSPKNFDRGYDGVVPAKRALERSLNVPAVRMLNDYGVDRFYHDLQRLGFTSLTQNSDHYGLSLILGGAEASLWELCGVYGSIARALIHYTERESRYFRDDYRKPVFLFNENPMIAANSDLSAGSKSRNSKKDISDAEEHGVLGAGAIYLTFKSLLEVNRPETEAGWESFRSSGRVAWKTGTSFGFRDAWAVGTTPDFVVAVWVGNADGVGRPGLTGITAAAPVMFEVFNLLPPTGWFEIPYDDMVKADICKKSGHRPSIDCQERDSVWLTPAGLFSPVCPYHKLIHLSEDKKFRVNASCYDPLRMEHTAWFILPPLQEYYYKSRDPGYMTLLPLLNTCKNEETTENMQMIYPEKGAVVYIPFELQGERGRMVCEAAHRYQGSRIFWHLDDEYLGTTEYIHQMAIMTNKGKHLLTLVDQDGNRLSTGFEVVDREE